MQGIATFTFNQDTKRILEVIRHKIAVHATDWANTVTVGLKGVIQHADAIFENPLASEARQAGALESLIQAWAQIGKLLETRGFNDYTR